MATTRRELNIVYSGNATGVRKTLGYIDKLHSSFASRLKTLGAGLTSVGRTLTTTLTLPLVGMGFVAAREFEEFRQVAEQTEAVIQSTGGAAGVTAEHLQALGERLGKLAALDNDVVQSAGNMLLTFTQIRNEVGAGNDVFDQALQSVADVSFAMKTDMSSAAVQVGKALNDPIKGITALTRVGVTFSDEQREQITNLVESNDLMGAQKIILAELEREFGGSAKAAGKAAGPLTKIKLTLMDLAEKAGPYVVKILQKISTWVSKVADWFEHLSPGAKELVIKLAAIAAAAGPVMWVLGKITGLAGGVVGAFGGLTRALGTSGAAFGPWGLAAAGAVLLLIDLQDGGLGVAEVLGQTLAEALTDQKQGFEGVLKVAGVLDDKYRAMGGTVADLADEIAGAEGATARQRTRIANSLLTLDDWGIELSDAAKFTLETYLASGNLKSAIKLLRSEIERALGPMERGAAAIERWASGMSDAVWEAKRLRAEVANFPTIPGTNGGGGDNGDGDTSPGPKPPLERPTGPHGRMAVAVSIDRRRFARALELEYARGW